MEHPSHFHDERPYPLQRHLGFVLTDWSEDYCRLELPLADFLMNRQGIVHGGVYATLADTAMGYAGCFAPQGTPPRLAMTLNLNVNYLAQSKGEMLIATARRTGGGHKTFSPMQASAIIYPHYLPAQLAYSATAAAYNKGDKYDRNHATHCLGPQAGWRPS